MEYIADLSNSGALDALNGDDENSPLNKKKKINRNDITYHGIRKGNTQLTDIS